MSVNIAVFVSGGGTNLQALIDAQVSGVISSGQIKLVVSNTEGAYAITRAENANIKAVTMLKKNYGSINDYENALIELMHEEQIDVIVLAGFLYVLSPIFVSAFPDRIINVHPSLIPSFCGDGFYGLKVHEEALKYGVKVTGATVHFVNEITDGGKIIAQKAVYVKEDDTPEMLQKRVMEEAEWILLPQATETVCKKLQGE